MKNLCFSSFIFLTLSSYASIMETSFKVKVTYHNAQSKKIKLAPVRIVLRYNEDANLLSQAVKKDCAAVAGRSELLGLWKKESISPCISYKSSIVVPEDFIMSLLNRSNSYSFYVSSKKLETVIANNANFSNLTNTDDGNNKNLLFAIRNLLGQATKTQIINLNSVNKFALKGKRVEFFTVELVPGATKLDTTL